MRKAQQDPKQSSGRTLFSKLTSSQQSYADALRQDKQHQQPQAMQTERQYLSQRKFQKTHLSVQVPSSFNNDTVASVVHQIRIELSKAVSEEDRVMVIIKLVLNLMQQNGCQNSSAAQNHST
jgi:predicted membrane protein